MVTKKQQKIPSLKSKPRFSTKLLLLLIIIIAIPGIYFVYSSFAADQSLNFSTSASECYLTPPKASPGPKNNVVLLDFIIGKGVQSIYFNYDGNITNTYKVTKTAGGKYQFKATYPDVAQKTSRNIVVSVSCTVKGGGSTTYVQKPNDVVKKDTK